MDMEVSYKTQTSSFLSCMPLETEYRDNVEFNDKEKDTLERLLPISTQLNIGKRQEQPFLYGEKRNGERVKF